VVRKALSRRQLVEAFLLTEAISLVPPVSLSSPLFKPLSRVPAAGTPQFLRQLTFLIILFFFLISVVSGHLVKKRRPPPFDLSFVYRRATRSFYLIKSWDSHTWTTPSIGFPASQNLDSHYPPPWFTFSSTWPDQVHFRSFRLFERCFGCFLTPLSPLSLRNILIW